MSASKSPFRPESNDPSDNSLPPERLWEAVDASLAAMKDVAEYTGGRRLTPLELLGSPLQPAILSQFTKFEIEEASKFLVRMGAIELSSGPRPGQNN